MKPKEILKIQIERDIHAATEANNSKIGFVTGLEFVPGLADSMIPKDTFLKVYVSDDDAVLFLDGEEMQEEFQTEGKEVPSDRVYYLQIDRRSK